MKVTNSLGIHSREIGALFLFDLLDTLLAIFRSSVHFLMKILGSIVG